MLAMDALGGNRIGKLETFIPEDIRTLYEIHNYRNAAQVLATGCPEEFQEIIEGLRTFRLTLADIRKPGGNESDIPKRSFQHLPLGPEVHAETGGYFPEREAASSRFALADG